MWNDIRLHAETNDNFILIWCNKTAKKFAYTAYMAYIQHLPTADRLTKWGMTVVLQCNLCNNHNESHQHIFMEFEFSTYLWTSLLCKLVLQSTPLLH